MFQLPVPLDVTDDEHTYSLAFIYTTLRNTIKSNYISFEARLRFSQLLFNPLNTKRRPL